MLRSPEDPLYNIDRSRWLYLDDTSPVILELESKVKPDNIYREPAQALPLERLFLFEFPNYQAAEEHILFLLSELRENKQSQES